MIERLKDIFYKPGRSLEHQMFIFGTIAVILGLTSAFFISVLVPLSASLTIVSAISLIACTAAALYSLSTHRFMLGNVTYVIFAIFITFPLGILVGGGIYSGAPIWFVIAIVYIAMVFERKWFFVCMTLALAVFVVTAAYSYQHPELFQVEYTPFSRFMHIMLSIVCLSILVGSLIRYQQVLFKTENQLAYKQNEEIQALSDAQNRFFSSMSHEIRTPLNTIIGLNEMTLRDQGISEEVAENSANIQNAGRMLLSLINDILDLSKIESGRMELSNVQYETSGLLSDVVNMLWIRAKEKNLDLEVNVGENVPSMLFGDEMRIKQVIINILSNAIKYTDFGAVSLTLDGEDRGSNEFLLRIEVDDTGIGIRREVIPYLFDSFKRIDTERNRSVEGTGLGLAISKQLVDLMGGTITVDSIYTKGSHFQVEVPQKIVDAEPMQYKSIASKATRASYSSIFEAPEARVLIVDDNDMNRMVSRKLLRDTRVQVDAVSSGAECLEKTAEIHYDVIFMDHEMPGMNGVETLRKISEQEGGLCKTTPVIALTANAGSDMNAFYLNNGFQAYLAKPIHGSLLEATLLQFLPPELIEHIDSSAESETIRVGASRHKLPFIVTVDCPCDIPESMLKENGIVRMPTYIVTKEGRFRDLEEIDPDNLFGYFEQGGRTQSSPASVEEYEAFFGDMLERAETVFHLSVSPKVSVIYDHAKRAASSFGNVHVINSNQNSTGLGFVTLQAVKLAKEGLAPEEIIKQLDAYSDKVVTTVLVPSVDSPIVQIGMPPLLRGLVKTLSWAPVLHMKRSGLKLAGFHGNYINSAAEKYIRSTMFMARRTAKKDLLIVVYSGCSLKQQEEIKAQVEKHSVFDQIIMQKASATIAANTWVGSFGLMYVKE